MVLPVVDVNNMYASTGEGTHVGRSGTCRIRTCILTCTSYMYAYCDLHVHAYLCARILYTLLQYMHTCQPK